MVMSSKHDRCYENMMLVPGGGKGRVDSFVVVTLMR